MYKLEDGYGRSWDIIVEEVYCIENMGEYTKVIVKPFKDDTKIAYSVSNESADGLREQLGDFKKDVKVEYIGDVVEGIIYRGGKTYDCQEIHITYNEEGRFNRHLLSCNSYVLKGKRYIDFRKTAYKYHLGLYEVGGEK